MNALQYVHRRNHTSKTTLWQWRHVYITLSLIVKWDILEKILHLKLKIHFTCIKHTFSETLLRNTIIVPRKWNLEGIGEQCSINKYLKVSEDVGSTDCHCRLYIVTYHVHVVGQCNVISYLANEQDMRPLLVSIQIWSDHWGVERNLT